MFGAKVVSSVGEVRSSKRGLMSQKLKVHALRTDSPATPYVGMELSSPDPRFAGVVKARN
jgi:hypothetical protein